MNVQNKPAWWCSSHQHLPLRFTNFSRISFKTLLSPSKNKKMHWNWSSRKRINITNDDCTHMVSISRTEESAELFVLAFQCTIRIHFKSLRRPTSNWRQKKFIHSRDEKFMRIDGAGVWGGLRVPLSPFVVQILKRWTVARYEQRNYKFRMHRQHTNTHFQSILLLAFFILCSSFCARSRTSNN